MTELQLLPDGALASIDVGISVSDSADLARLGLSSRHAELAIGEIARAVLIAGGRITYGGRIKPSGFTHVLMDEVRRYGTARLSLTVCLALPEHRKLSSEELDQIDRSLGTWGRLVILDSDGKPIAQHRDRPEDRGEIEDDDLRRASYAALRRYMNENTHARVIVGGQLLGAHGRVPGVVEEALLAIAKQTPLYVAGGFGGAAAAVASVLEPRLVEWLPSDIPEGYSEPTVARHLEALRSAAVSADWNPEANGLTDNENALLASTHRPGEIASVVVLGMARKFSRQRG